MRAKRREPLAMHFDTIVLGAGINGLSASYHLLRRGVKSLALVEQHTLGHHLGSSHGMSRITRSSYSSAKYVEMIQVAHSQEWPRLAKEAGKSFLHPTPGCFFGPGNGAYLESVQAVPESPTGWRFSARPKRVRPSPVLPSQIRCR